MDGARILDGIWRSPTLLGDFDEICACGGRFAGSPSEAKAAAFLSARLREIAGGVRVHTFPSPRWTREHSSVRLPDSGVELASTSLVLSPATPADGLELEVIDVGRGTVEEFREHRDEIPGRAVLVPHEFPFSLSHVHRRRKYGWAKAAGARGFLISNNIPGCGVVTGSSGRGAPDDLPSVGLSYEGGALLRRAAAAGRARVRIDIRTSRSEGTASNLIAEVPGRGDEWVILCAHYDGHDLAESAMDNASGVAAVLEALRAVAPGVAQGRRGLRVMFFTVEEWALLGSKVYLETLPEADRRKIALAVNLDTVVGGRGLSALTSGMPDVAAFVRTATSARGIPVAPVGPVQASSDHYNFFLHGIPSFRLIAGYEDPTSLTRYLLTPADTRDKVSAGELRVAAMVAADLVLQALRYDGPIARHRDPEEIRQALDQTDPWVSDRVRPADETG